MKAFTTLTSTVLYLPVDHIDTDQIIPARFLKTTEKTGFGENAFHDWRYLPDGKENPDFAMNREPGRSAKILFTGDNFGCGSSREHAPWAILQAGFDVVIARGFADIFSNNSRKNGLLLITLPENSYHELKLALAEDGGKRMTVDLPAQAIAYGSLRLSFEIDSFYKMCLLQGLDDFGYLLKNADAIRAFEAKNGKR